MYYSNVQCSILYVISDCTQQLYVCIKISMHSFLKHNQINQPDFYSAYIKVNNIGFKGQSSEGRWIIFLEVSGFLEFLW